MAPHVWPQRLNFSRLVYNVLFIHGARRELHLFCFLLHADNPLLIRRGTLMITSRNPTSLADPLGHSFPETAAPFSPFVVPAREVELVWTPETGQIMAPLHG